ncbi:hypothetical protein NDU88_005153 [Pleurodeles waltl]|uniref:Uncharacterized protein n=1 Tax=Pleurodeles waltl TaxID=8319 RepID=A0AAV7QH10_PLEWA|nr:hypothetical protein NDU88_005153 [Pleurodeles waltl]
MSCEAPSGSFSCRPLATGRGDRGPLGRRQTNFNDGGASSIDHSARLAGPGPAAPRTESHARPVSGTLHGPLMLLAPPGRDLAPRSMRQPPLSALPLSPTQSGERVVLCLPLSSLRFFQNRCY